MKRRSVSVVIFLLTTWSAPSISAMTWEHLLKIKKTEPVLANFYLQGLMDGVQISNIGFYYRNKLRLYCPPENLALNSDNLTQIIEDYQKKYSTRNTEEVSVVASLALQEAFPCK